MARMKAAEAAVLILEKEGATQAFGLPGAAINPFYAAMRRHGGIRRREWIWRATSRCVVGRRPPREEAEAAREHV